MVKSYRAPGYGADHPLIPHGISVILNAPAVFRFTAAVSPERHLEAAAALAADVRNCKPADAGDVLADRIVWFMRRLGVPNGLREVGYQPDDFPALVEGTLPQHRVQAFAAPGRAGRAGRALCRRHDSLVGRRPAMHGGLTGKSGR
jgi:hydroxyacid-oxoacid transhydrogenase